MPPKRLTRARAATKEPEAASLSSSTSSSSSSSRPAKIVTAAAAAAAAKARAPLSSSLTASTASTAAKRKTRSDDAEEEQRQATQVKRPRGRPPKKPVGGDQKGVAMAASVLATTTSKAAEPPEPVKRGRGRPPAAMKPATSTTTIANKPPVKKMVTFREPDKENMEPAAAPKEPPPPTGMRGRPARRGGAAAGRPGRPPTKASKPQGEDKRPLSPKKITQLIHSRTDSADESEDELALEKVNAKPLSKSPIKPPSKKSEPIPAEIEPADTNIAVNAMMFDMPDMTSTLFTSPARRPTSPPRDTIKSPAKRMAVPLPGSALKLSSDAVAQTPFKSSAPNLLQSAAKRPQSPMKPFIFSAQKERPGESSTKPSMLHSPAKRAMPGFKPVLSAHRGLPTLDETPVGTPTRAARSSTRLMMEVAQEDDEEEEPFEGPIEIPRFSMSSPAGPSSEARYAVTEVEEEEEEAADAEPVDAEDAEVEEAEVEEGEAEDAEAEDAPQPNPRFSQLRQKDLDPCHDMSSMSDSEDDTLPFERSTATPSTSGERTTSARASRSPVKQSRRSTLGFGALSDQLGTWSAASPVKSARSFVVENEAEDAEEDLLEHEVDASNPDTPMKNAFSGSERLSMQPEGIALPDMGDAEDQQLDEEAMITDEDLALAQEANEMSLMDPKEEDAANTRHSFDDSLSDASQEYGDENQVPVESPTPSAAPRAPPPVTPVSRPVTRSFNTTTKVPLKAADNSTPSPLKKKSLSTPRAAPKRSSQPKRTAPVLAYTPERPRRRSSRNISTISEEPEQSAEEPSMPEPKTPEAKVDLWASIGTPARTPRRDLNPNLLRGAIVFVDVHTSEGADASGIFVEVLTQMGARCPQKWNWNPSSASNTESTKVGITHVVFKDGSKRTLEKVREAKGVVQCVGVSWVLDCERDNKWLDESPYSIDTGNVPRGGARRRKSMEPRTVSNKDGSAVSSSSEKRRASSSSASSSSKTPNRRQSSIWVHTPSDPGDEEQEEEDIEWSNLILTPVPKTPAPETLMKFAAETPSNLETDEEDEEDASPTREELMTRTCPPKAQKYLELGGGILSRSKDSDENVMQRLMAARRKSLQFAPKVGSPLAKMWQ
ncbi:hypothetical protein M440DRAFT_1339188 [Trichoderma longibrachiatum ATCC 18648]|uniref:BRCT domain-containing protein n=1 Tax=Trichoderma longibrachiatum ATCC 18648 TaxID=983965 RepID=A0A2T4BXF8_TRILO|nr:hypothetical protein M440DRAFT_1339188 [Trichoderma longibrachiatum ATCC 18648]